MIYSNKHLTQLLQWTALLQLLLCTCGMSWIMTETKSQTFHFNSILIIYLDTIFDVGYIKWKKIILTRRRKKLHCVHKSFIWDTMSMFRITLPKWPKLSVQLSQAAYLNVRGCLPVNLDTKRVCGLTRGRILKYPRNYITLQLFTDWLV